jgi:hypothetical protein
VVDATRATVDNEAELVAASARFSCPLATSYLAVSVQDLMAADSLSMADNVACATALRDVRNDHGKLPRLDH